MSRILVLALLAVFVLSAVGMLLLSSLASSNLFVPTILTYICPSSYSSKGVHALQMVQGYATSLILPLSPRVLFLTEFHLPQALLITTSSTGP